MRSFHPHTHISFSATIKVHQVICRIPGTIKYIIAVLSKNICIYLSLAHLYTIRIQISAMAAEHGLCCFCCGETL